MIFFKNKETKKKVENLIDQLGYEYKFVFVLAPTVKGFFPIIEQLLINGSTDIEITKESIVYLTIASLAQLLDKPASQVKELMAEVKKRKLEEYIPKVKKVIKIFKRTVNFFLRKSKMMIKNYLELFSYTALFVPFALTFSDIISSSGLSLNEFISAFSKDFSGKLVSTTFGIGAFTVKHFINDVFNYLKNLKSKPKEIVQILNNKLNIKESINLVSFDEYYLYID